MLLFIHKRISIAEAQKGAVVHKTEDQDREHDIARNTAVEATGKKDRGAEAGKDVKEIEAAKDETLAEVEKDTDTEATVKIKIDTREIEVQAERES